jgi:hypothetical protein
MHAPASVNHARLQTPPFYIIATSFLRAWFAGELIVKKPAKAAAGSDSSSAIPIDDDDEDGDLIDTRQHARLPRGAPPPTEIPYPALGIDYNRQLLCPAHGRADPRKWSEFKVIPRECWQAIVDDGYAEITPLPHHALCVSCFRDGSAPVDQPPPLEPDSDDVACADAGKQPPSYVALVENEYVSPAAVDGDLGDAECECPAASQCRTECTNRGLFTECGERCASGAQCTNQRLRRREYACELNVVKTAHCGWGVQNETAVKSGALIIEYCGRVVDLVRCALVPSFILRSIDSYCACAHCQQLGVVPTS